MELIPLTKPTAVLCLEWRRASRDSLRTPYMIYPQQQEHWYERLMKTTKMRYFEVMRKRPPAAVAVTGLTDIEFENARAQISLIVDPVYAKRGVGSWAVQAMLDEAFNRMGLNSVYAECYDCNPALGFWRKIADRHGASVSRIPQTKYLRGEFHDSHLFTFTRKS